MLAVRPLSVALGDETRRMRMALENLFKVDLIVMFKAAWLATVRWVWTHQRRVDQDEA